MRKVLGASEIGLVAMLSKDFIKLFALIMLIAFPFAWWAMNKWLESFTYRINITWWVFLVAGAIANYYRFYYCKVSIGKSSYCITGEQLEDRMIAMEFMLCTCFPSE